MTISNCKTILGWLLLAACIGPWLSPPAPCWGQTDRLQPVESEKPSEKIHVTSQRLISDQSKNVAEFVGDVVVRQGQTQISADSLKIFFSSKSGDSQASPAQSLDKLVAIGNVEIKFDNRLAVARQAVYITAQRVLILNGPGASVTSGENTITGETITFYRADGRFTVEGGAKGRVKAVILPDESGLE